MGTLVFVRPASGEEVSTGAEMDIPTLSQLELAKIYCPHCQQPHDMFGVEYWLSHTDMPITEHSTRSASPECSTADKQVFSLREREWRSRTRLPISRRFRGR